VLVGRVKATMGAPVCTGAEAVVGADLFRTVAAGWDMRGSADGRGAKAAGEAGRTEAACRCD